MSRFAFGTFVLLTACSPPPSAAPVEVAPPPDAPGVRAATGDRCEAPFACSADHTLFLRCDGQGRTFVSKCRGPRGCRVKDDAVLCDQSIAEIGDACTGDSAACALDGLNLLVCRDGRFTLKSACTAGCEADTRKRLSCHGVGVTP